MWGKELYFDATKVEANASLDAVKPRFTLEAHLAQLFDSDANVVGACAVEPEPLSVGASEAELEHPAMSNSERHDWIVEEGRQNRRVKGPECQRVSDLKASSMDPDSTAYRKARRKRQVWGKPLLGEGMQWHGLGRFRLRCLRRVNSETQLIATGQNLKILLRWSGWDRRYFPGGAAGMAIGTLYLELTSP